MEASLEKQVGEIGMCLSQPPPSKDLLVKVLKQAASLFSEVEQSPPANIINALNPSVEALVQPAILNHMDNEVRLLVATCISEILRIVAPDAPYSDSELKDVFQLIVESFRGLDELTTTSFSRRVSILETVSTVKSCVVMLDLELDDLILEMFQAFFSTVSGEHPQKVVNAMRDIMSVVIEESEDISQPLLDVLLSNLAKKNVSASARQLAVAVVQNCAQNLEPFVRQFLTSPASDVKMLPSGLRSDYHELVYEIYRCAPSLLVNVISNLLNELSTDAVDVRVKAVEHIGKLFALPGDEILSEFKQLFSGFIKRFTDKDAEVRLAMIECAKNCLITKPFGPIATELTTNLTDRLQDHDMEVRTNVVVALCELGKLHPACIPLRIVRRIAQRLRDKEVIVRKATLKGLMDLYRVLCLMCYQGSFLSNESFDWIPSKIFHCYFDKECLELRPHVIDIIFTEELFPPELPINVVVEHWIAIFSTFDKNDKKAFRWMLSQKKRLQLEMQNYLLLQQKVMVEDNDEIRKKMHACCKNMLLSFPDPVKTEKDFQKLSQHIDSEILQALTLLLDASTMLSLARICRDNLLNWFGEKDSLYDFMKMLTTKISFISFGKGHLTALLDEILHYKAEGMQLQLEACMGLFMEFALSFPIMIEGLEDGLVDLLKDSTSYLRGTTLQLLSKIEVAKIGKLIESSGVALDKLCWEGSRNEAKYAVQAILAGGDSGFKTLSDVYVNLVENLETTPHLPAVFQSLGSIAQFAMPIYESREEDIIEFIIKNLFHRDNGDSTDGLHPSMICQLKIYGLKSVIKSFLASKDSAHFRQRFKGFVGVLVKLLQCGGISDDVNSSVLDKAHLRFAAAKGVLRLSKLWDAEISPLLFRLTVLVSQDPSLHVQHEFLVKVYQYLKERLIPHKYACAFPLFIAHGSKEMLPEVKQYMADFIESSRREIGRLEQSSEQSDDKLIMHYPEYIIFYLVHILSHTVSFPPLDGEADIEQVLVPICKQLLFIIWMLLRQDCVTHEDVSKKDARDSVSLILSIFRLVKQSDGAVDNSKYNNACILSDIGILITKETAKNQSFSENYACQIPLPPEFFQPCQTKDDDFSEKDGSKLLFYISDDKLVSRLQDLRSELYLQSEESLCSGMKNLGSDISTTQDEEKEIWVVPLHKHPSGNNIVDGGNKDYNVQDIAAATSTPGRSRGRRGNAKEKTMKSPGNVPIFLGTLDQAGSLLKRRSRSSKEDGDFPSPEQKIVDSDVAPLESSQSKRRGRPKATNKHVDSEAGLEIPSGQAGVINKGMPETPLIDTENVSGSVDGDTVQSEHKKSSRNATGKSVRLSVKKSRLGKEILSELLDETHDQTTDSDVHGEHDKESEGRRLRKSTQGKEEVVEGTVDQLRSPRGTPRSTRKKIADVITEHKNPDDKLLGCRIKVWWPLDKKFYEGVVESFDQAKKRHKVCYLDGDVEFLNLERQRWEFMDGDGVLSEGLSILSPEMKTQALSTTRKNESTSAMTKARATVISEISTNDEHLRSPRKRKNIAVKEVDDTGVVSPTVSTAINATDTKEETVINSEDKMKVNKEEIEIEVVHETKSELKDVQKSRKRSSASEKPSEDLSQVPSPRRSSKRKTVADRASSPSGSKDSDDAPLNTWKSRTRNAH